MVARYRSLQHGRRTALSGCYLLLASLAFNPVAASEHEPPAAIVRVIDAPMPPSGALSGDGRSLALYTRQPHPSLSELATPVTQLAGLRFDPANSGPAPSDIEWIRAITLLDVATRTSTPLALPEQARIAYPSWSPDGQYLAFVRVSQARLTLWVASITGQTRAVSALALNAVAGQPFVWTPDSAGFIVLARTASPAPPATGPDLAPRVHVSDGQARPERTYQGLLQSTQDHARLAHHARSHPTHLTLDGNARPLTHAPGLYDKVAVSPDGRYVLVEQVWPPFSPHVPWSRFARTADILDRHGHLLRRVQHRTAVQPDHPDFDAVEPGPRHPQWRADAPATLIWAEALDAGDPQRVQVERDAVHMLAAPFQGQGRRLATLSGRFAGIYWLDDEQALVIARWWRNRQEERLLVPPAQPARAIVVSRRNYQDRYLDPGLPLRQENAAGQPIMQRAYERGRVYLHGRGFSPQGEFPFLDRVDLRTGARERLWRAQSPDHETVLAVLDAPYGERLLTRHQNAHTPPNFQLRDLARDTVLPLTQFEDPLPAFAAVGRHRLTYTRRDGLPLAATLHLPPPPADRPSADSAKPVALPVHGVPPSDRAGRRLPLLIWIYPDTHADQATAGQVTASDHRFRRPVRISPLALTLHGYAVLEHPSMPIVGPADTANDQYIAQLIANARAAVEAAVDTGLIDPCRIAVAGHSYGAFSTANLLAHTRLFAAGIALSGAYNRTLTPFGFQAEPRHYWQAMATYHAMSPFSAADRIDAPLLLIHGVADANAGTHPMQSRRMFDALKGLGKVARLVELPHEGHGYRARESLLRVQAEMAAWLDTHLKAGQTSSSCPSSPADSR